MNIFNIFKKKLVPDEFLLQQIYNEAEDEAIAAGVDPLVAWKCGEGAVEEYIDSFCKHGDVL